LAFFFWKAPDNIRKAGSQQRVQMKLRRLEDGSSDYLPHRRLAGFDNLLRTGLISILCLVCGLLARSLSGGENWSPSNFSRVDWQPTRAVNGQNSVGANTCAKCHPEEATTQSTSPMGLALERPMDSQILRSLPRLGFREGPFDYTIMRNKDQVIYTVSDGQRSISEPVVATFGQGEAGQTYLLQHKGSYYESRLSFFRDVQSLDLTLGHSTSVPPSLESSLGKKLTSDEVTLCFACHSTGSVSGKTLRLDHMIPGITCEGCHGPGREHLAAIESGRLKQLAIFNPGKLPADDLVDFCGSCHRGAFQAQLLGVSGIQTVRYQPYRLVSSRCFRPEDRRISCLACHDPHQGRDRDAAFYDAKCLACHHKRTNDPTNAEDASSTCPVETRTCTHCHMPRYSLPGGHLDFTDHRIRVVREKRFPD
jgi:Cytochrome c554 and c-prime